jgi:plastocyanin
MLFQILARCPKRCGTVLLLVFLAISPAWPASIQASVTDDAGKPLADAVVTVTPAAGAAIPGAAFRTPDMATIDQRNETFVPMVVVIRTGGSVVFRNSDVTRHHVYSFASIKRFELVQSPGDVSEPVRFVKPGTAAIGCNIHDHMIAYVQVTDAPWAGVTDADGKVELSGLPAGGFVVSAWHPRLPPTDAAPTRSVTLVSNETRIVVVLPVLAPRRWHGPDY